MTFVSSVWKANFFVWIVAPIATGFTDINVEVATIIWFIGLFMKCLREIKRMCKVDIREIVNGVFVC